ncbi:MAG: hypothetical protein M3M96_09600 [Candidatus Eremiobacteraeota bacterium]|nr:hypothetical protein [Candidatus Eremiobacteraeota bacterium]
MVADHEGRYSSAVAYYRRAVSVANDLGTIPIQIDARIDLSGALFRNGERAAYVELQQAMFLALNRPYESDDFNMHTWLSLILKHADDHNAPSFLRTMLPQ